MVIKNINVYRDGGTVLVETDECLYWISVNPKRIYKGDGYFKGDAKIVTDIDEIMILTYAISRMASTYKEIKRLIW